MEKETGVNCQAVWNLLILYLQIVSQFSFKNYLGLCCPEK